MPELVAWSPLFSLCLLSTLVLLLGTGLRHVPGLRESGDSFSRAVCLFRAALTPIQAQVPVAGEARGKIVNIQPMSRY